MPPRVNSCLAWERVSHGYDEPYSRCVSQEVRRAPMEIAEHVTVAEQLFPKILCCEAVRTVLT